jgi:hypothetical protein
MMTNYELRFLQVVEHARFTVSSCQHEPGIDNRTRVSNNDDPQSALLCSLVRSKRPDNFLSSLGKSFTSPALF